METCSACECPATVERTECAFCGAHLRPPSAVAFTVEPLEGGYGWYTANTLVASATDAEGTWTLRDARHAVVATMVGLAGSAHHALVGPDATLLGSIRSCDEQASGRAEASTAVDPDGATLLVLRRDGTSGAHVVDADGDVVALASWEDPRGPSDVLITATGTRHSLALVFSLLLRLELSRQVRDAA